MELTEEQKETLAADSKWLSDQGYSPEFIKGYEMGVGDGIKNWFGDVSWFKIQDRLPDHDKRVLLFYSKGKKSGSSRGSIGEYIVEGYLTDTAKRASSKTHDYSFWERHGYGLTFFDYTDRQIQSLKAKKSNNIVSHWAYLPEKPE